ncbi:unnamed protein product [Parascedosporium putredinis]|uniref:DUF1996 domain-containing protein n=1 Tax=Parascedosporium putredinis TaxID=1442378 RepID=A0A9P1M9V1_9PEZI|nr:unnamed protein product [Parascedosporium putredinis]CAI7991552.1 unnamed protein product [Parascedosporium putredinis]
MRVSSIVDPGIVGTPHLHQIVGGNGFDPLMDPDQDPAERSSCTTCTFIDDFSNYWTAVMFFRARNGTYKRVRQFGAVFHEAARGGGMTIYYFPPESAADDSIKITAFPQGFRMRTGDPGARTAEASERGIWYTCMENESTRTRNQSRTFPDHACPFGVLTTIWFPPCWDGVNLDSSDHYSHVAWPADGDPMDGTACPETHPVLIPQIVLETVWDTAPFNSADLWPEDGSQPFVWSFGDDVGYGHHADYVFGWRGDSLQKAMDERDCGDQMCGLPVQDIPTANECEGCLFFPKRWMTG